MSFINNDLFRRAVFEGNLQMFRHLLSSGANRNNKDNENSTELLDHGSSSEISKQLMSFGPDLEEKDDFGWTPLCSAVGDNDLETVKILLLAGAKVNVRTKIENTPLHIAPNVELTRVLISHGAEVNAIDKFGRTPIHSALIDGKGFDMFLTLLNAGADVKIKMGRFENTLLHYADSLDFTRELLLHGAHLNAKKIDGQTPLHCAVQHMKELAVVQELLNFGAGVNIQDNEDETPLGLAIRCHTKNFDVIKELLKHGADINFDVFDCSLFNYCTIIESAMFNDLSCAKLLVKMFILKNCNECSPIKIEFDVQIHPDNGKIILKYKDDCFSEINQMKFDRMFIKYTLYELLLEKDGCVKPIYGSYRTIKQNFENKYPIYHDVILEEVRKGLERGKLLNRLEQFFVSLNLSKNIEKEIKLNSDCLLLIARYLNDSDILSIILMFEDYFFHT